MRKLLLLLALFGTDASAVKQIGTAGIANSAVTNAKLANMANATFKCRTSAGTGAPEDCTATQVAAILPTLNQDTTGSAGSLSITFTSGLPLFGQGTGVPTLGSVTGNTTKVATSTGSLTSGNCAKWDADGNIVDAGAACGTGGGSGSSITKAITQTAHGFSVGNVVYFNGTSYAAAEANADSTSEVVGIVSAVADADNFTLTTGGYVSGLSGLTAGHNYVLSDVSAGALEDDTTFDASPTVGHIRKPLLVADSTTSGYFFNHVGVKIAEAVTPSNLSSSSTGNEHVERIFFGNSGTNACSSSPCTIVSQSGSWATSVTRNSTGSYTINVASGVFSSVPVCVVSRDQNMAATVCGQNYSASTTTAIDISCQNYSNTFTDQGPHVICMGPY